MPKRVKLTREEREELARVPEPKRRLDLTPYLELLEGHPKGEWSPEGIDLEPGEQPRVIKRYLTQAAEMKGYAVDTKHLSESKIGIRLHKLTEEALQQRTAIRERARQQRAEKAIAEGRKPRGRPRMIAS